MAVKLTVYGEADLRQIEKAREELDRLEAKAREASSGFAGSMSRLGGSISSAGQKMSAMGDSMTKNVTVPLLAVGAGLYKATEAAAEDEAAANQLAVALHNVAGATKSQIASTEDWISKQTLATGISDDQLRPALERLTRSTHDIKEAQDLTSLAMEISVAKHLDLTTVSSALAKANDGQFNALKKLGISMGDQAKNAAASVTVAKALKKAQDEAALALQQHGEGSKEYEKAAAKVAAQQDKLNAITKQGADWTKELAAEFKGSLSADAETAAGKQRRLKNALSETTENLGYAFLPMMESVADVVATKVAPAIQAAADWFGKLSPGIKQAALIIGGLAAAMGPVLSITGRVTDGVGKLVTKVGQAPAMFAKMQTAASSAFTFLAANPMVAVALGIAALVAAVVVLYNHWGWFHDRVKPIVDWFKEQTPKAFEKVKEVALSVVQWFQQAWAKWGDDILAVATAAWGGIKAAVETTIGVVRSVVEGFVGAVQAVWSVFGDNILRQAKLVWEGIRGVISGYLDIIKGVVNTVMALIHGDWGKAWDGIKQIVSGVLEVIGSLIRYAVGTLRNAMGAVMDALKAVVSLAWDGIKLAFSTALDGLVALVKGLVSAFQKAGELVMDGLKAGFTAGWKILTGAWNIAKDIKDKFLGAADWLLSAGGDIIDGLWQGIKRKSGEFAANIGRWIKEHIPGPVRSIMGIESPSRVMMELGGYVGEGLALGIERTSGLVSKSSAALGTAAIDGVADVAQTFTGTFGSSIYRSVQREVSGTFGSPIYMGGWAAGAKFGQGVQGGISTEIRDVPAYIADWMANMNSSSGLRSKLEKEAEELGYHIGKALSDSVSETITDTDAYITQWMEKLNGQAKTASGSVAVLGASSMPGVSSMPGGSSSSSLSAADLYAGFGGNMGEWARRTMADLADWNARYNVGGPQVRAFAVDPFKGGTLLDANGNPVYADDIKALSSALAYQQGAQVNVQAGAITVNVGAGADTAAVREGVSQALDQFATSLGAL